MPLADRITQRPDVVHGSPCSVAKLFEYLEQPGREAELAAFELIMYGRSGLRKTTRGYLGWTEREVFDVVTDEGYNVAQSQINKHRGEKCRCFRDVA